MWNDEKQGRFDALRIKEAQGALSNAEAQKLQEFFAELEAEEAKVLRKSMEQMDARLDFLRAEKERVEAKNERLAAIAVEQEHLLADARDYLTHLRRKQGMLRAEYRKATGQELVTRHEIGE